MEQSSSEGQNTSLPLNNFGNEIICTDEGIRQPFVELTVHMAGVLYIHHHCKRAGSHQNPAQSEESLPALPKTLLLLPLSTLTTHQGVVHRVLEGDTETGVRERTNFKLQDARRI